MDKAAKTVEIDFAKYESEKGVKFHPDDLTPSKIKHVLNKVFTLERKTGRYTASGGGEGGGGIEIPSIVKLSGSGKSSYSREELKEHLRQFDLTVEFDGDVIVPRSLKVYSFDRRAFDASLTYHVKWKVVSTPSGRQETQTVQLGGLDKKLAMTQTARLEELLRRYEAYAASTEHKLGGITETQTALSKTLAGLASDLADSKLEFYALNTCLVEKGKPIPKDHGYVFEVARDQGFPREGLRFPPDAIPPDRDVIFAFSSHYEPFPNWDMIAVSADGPRDVRLRAVLTGNHTGNAARFATVLVLKPKSKGP